MKTLIQNHTLAARTVAGCLPSVILLAGLLAAPAQPLQPEVLFSFPRGGAYPQGNVVQGSDGNFYGTTAYGGSSDAGTVFKVTTNGTLTTLFSFSEANVGFGDFTHGRFPFGGLTLGSDGNFYGTTSQGGSQDSGTVFRMTTDGTLTTLVSFDVFLDGARPKAGLTLGNDGNFYGTTELGGFGLGTFFRVTTNGTLTILASFTGDVVANPNTALTLGNDGDFYSTTQDGGSSGVGTVFKVTTNGTLTRLVSFNTVNGARPNPQAALTLGNDGNFYGTAQEGGSGGVGTVFKVTTNGTLTRLVSFNTVNGAYPQTALTLGSGGIFYGTTSQGGSSGVGTVFKVTTSGTLTRLVSFNTTNGAYPQAALTLGSDGNFYGTTFQGGGTDLGTVFKVTTTGTLTRLASFNSTINGAYPQAGLALGSDGNFYGATTAGGSSGLGTVFKMTTNGTQTTLASFAGTNGADPRATLTLGSDGNFYGTTYSGGSSVYWGTVFKVTTNGTLTTLVSFDYPNGGQGLTLGSDGNFYGTTSQGGSSGMGTVFKVTTNGTLTTLASFAGTNGANPQAGLTLGSDGMFYGTTYGGGSTGNGTVFQVTTNGTLATLVGFNFANGSSPRAALTLGNDGNFYGTTYGGGSSGAGTVFKVTTNGTLTTLVSFDYANGAYANGSLPQAALTLGSDGNFYGTATEGGNSGVGTVFQVTTNGALATLISFNNANGAHPYAGLTLGSDGHLYGTTRDGGSAGLGTVFRLSNAPQFLSQPQPASQVVPAGVNVTINASVFGAPPLSYQWLFNTTNLPGATGASLTLNNVSLSMSGNYSLYVTNSLGTALSSNAVLTVLPAVVTTLPVSGITATGAVLNGSVTLGPNETLAWFEWGTDTNYGQIDGVTDIPGGSGTVMLNNALSGLDGNLIYHYRVVAWNSFGIASGTDQSFQVGLVPSAVTLSATVLTTNSVALNATVNPGGRHTTVWFKWGTNTSYGNLTPVTSVGSGSAPLNFNNLIPGLSLGTLYHGQVVASNSLGLVTGDNVSFLIGAPGAPLAVTGLATFVTGTNAWLHGLVTPNLLATTAWFEWGTDTNYGNTVLLGDVGNVGSALSVSNFLNGLDAAVTYHFRLAASNSVGVSFGADAPISTSLNAYAESVLADQPLVYYRFDEASGNLALNSGFLGAPANGTYNATVSLGNPSLVPAFGYAAGFNHTNSGVAVPALGTFTNVTIEAWLKPRSFGVPSAGRTLNSIYTTDNWVPGSLHTHFVDNGPTLHQYEFSANSIRTVDVGNSGYFPSNSWVHLAATYQRVTPARNSLIVYVNGRALTPTNSFDSTLPFNLAAAHIGMWTGAPFWFDGEIDEFAIYGTALPASRIQAHYQTAIGNPVLLSAQTTNKLAFSWIGPGFRLQRNPDLANAAGWTNVPAGSNSPVSVTLSNSGNQFFRLRWP